MSTPATVSNATKQTVQFPNKDSINEYVTNHPLAKEGVEINLYANASFATFADHFKDRNMGRDQIPKQLKQFMAGEIGKIKEYKSEDQKKLYDLDTAVLKLVDNGLEMEHCLSEPLRVTLVVLKSLTNDLLDNAEVSLLLLKEKRTGRTKLTSTGPRNWALSPFST